MSRARLYVVLLVALAVGIPLASAATDDPTPPPPPTIDPSSLPSNPSASRSASFTFSDTDPTVTFQCEIDGGGFVPCDTTASYSDLTDGSHTFGVKAVDPATLLESDVTPYTWVVDTTSPPAPKITATPKPDDATPAFGFTDAEAGVTFLCKLDSHSSAPCSSPKKYTKQADGVHTFRVRARDDAGNDSSPTSYTWTIDTVAPVLTITGKPPDPSRDTTARFDFSASDASTVTFRCQLDSNAAAACVSPARYAGLAPGVHTFTVRATDAAGNVSAVASYGWAVMDTLAPGDVRSIRRSVAYRLLKLAWSRPPDPDFKNVRVFVSKGQKGAKARRKTLVYDGPATHYTKKRYDNGTYHRYTIISYDSAGNASHGVVVVVRPSQLLLGPRLGAVIQRPPRLVWAGVRGASYYNVQLYRGGEKILSAWPNRPRLLLHARWTFKGRAFRLKSGTYAWYVWPAFGGRTNGRYGPLLGTSSFTVR